jgi:UDP-2-acetamido-2,6-beta-L-arabino-hexul-4-ose reductase
LELLYIDDLVDEMIASLKNEEHHCEFEGLEVVPGPLGRYCYVPITHNVELGEIIDLLKQFENQRTTLIIPEIPEGSFAKKLYSTYLSYLPKDKMVFMPKNNFDERGSFVEILRTMNCGQFSVNICNPGITRGQHWHNTKWEIFSVVYGHGLIQERQIGSDEIMSFEVTGDDIKAIQMLPGFTHNIINLSETEPLITFMWANEMFDPNRPDTYYEPVE